PERLADALDRAVRAPALTRSAATVAGRLAGEDGVGRVVEAVEAVGRLKS
ncbi:glycosyltransferase, partial [Streptomyces sp. SID625]|nr:glycosyltransferase [Streptomyces sp. SID625]